MPTLDTSADQALGSQQILQLMTGLRIRIDAANAQLVQLGLLTEFLYTQLEAQGVTIDMESYPTWAEARYKEIQAQAQEALDESKDEVEKIKNSIKEEIETAEQQVIADIIAEE